jgi:hypothetical protein
VSGTELTNEQLEELVARSEVPEWSWDEEWGVELYEPDPEDERQPVKAERRQRRAAREIHVKGRIVAVTHATPRILGADE